MLRITTLSLVLCVFGLTAATADEDDAPAAAKAAPTDGGTTPSLNGDQGYKGVAPGGDALPPHPPHMPVKGPQRLTWSGFQVKDGTPTVFVELTGTPDYSVDDKPGAVVVTFKNTVVPVKNNRRPLRVEGFDTPIQRVDTQPKGHAVQVTIHSKDTKPAHKEHIEKAAGGFQMLVIELPGK